MGLVTSSQYAVPGTAIVNRCGLSFGELDSSYRALGPFVVLRVCLVQSTRL